MKRTTSFLIRMTALSIIFSFMIITIGATAYADAPKLPEVMQWTTYGTTSSGYAQASAIAHAFLEKYKIKVRLLPSDTAVGRLLPIKLGRAHVGYLASETFFSSEGIFEFANPDWGPQDVRTVLAAPATFGVIVTKKSGIKTLYDLKGKRVTWIVGNPSHYSKMTAYLAFAGLTWDDVIRVDVPSYGQAWETLKSGQADAMVGSASAGAAYELDSSQFGIHYPPFPAEDKAGWERMSKVIDFFSPFEETVGAGISKEKPAHMTEYRYPIIVVFKDADPEFVYNYVKAMHESFGLYEKVTSVMHRWNVNQSGTAPSEAPFHEGAIRYLKEKGIWTEKHQSWNEKRLSRMEEIQKVWRAFLPEAKAKNLKGEEFEKAWLQKRAEMDVQ